MAKTANTVKIKVRSKELPNSKPVIYKVNYIANIDGNIRCQFDGQCKITILDQDRFEVSIMAWTDAFSALPMERGSEE